MRRYRKVVPTTENPEALSKSEEQSPSSELRQYSHAVTSSLASRQTRTWGKIFTNLSNLADDEGLEVMSRDDNGKLSTYKWPVIPLTNRDLLNARAFGVLPLLPLMNIAVSTYGLVVESPVAIAEGVTCLVASPFVALSAIPLEGEERKNRLKMARNYANHRSQIIDGARYSVQHALNLAASSAGFAFKLPFVVLPNLLFLPFKAYYEYTTGLESQSLGGDVFRGDDRPDVLCRLLNEISNYKQNTGDMEYRASIEYAILHPEAGCQRKKLFPNHPLNFNPFRKLGQRFGLLPKYNKSEVDLREKLANQELQETLANRKNILGERVGGLSMEEKNSARITAITEVIKTSSAEECNFRAIAANDLGNYGEAIKIYEEAIKKGSTSALVNFNQVLLDQHYDKLEVVADNCMMLADRGIYDPYIKNQLYLSYSRGNTVEWGNKIVEDDNVVFVEKDAISETIVASLKKRSGGNNNDDAAYANYRLGNHYEYGAEKDLEKAKECYLRSSELGFALADNRLGIAHKYGEELLGTNPTINLTLAKEYLNKARKQGLKDASSHLYLLHEPSIEGSLYTEAMEYRHPDYYLDEKIPNSAIKEWGTRISSYAEPQIDFAKSGGQYAYNADKKTLFDSIINGKDITTLDQPNLEIIRRFLEEKNEVQTDRPEIIKPLLSAFIKAGDEDMVKSILEKALLILKQAIKAGEKDKASDLLEQNPYLCIAVDNSGKGLTEYAAEAGTPEFYEPYKQKISSKTALEKEKLDQAINKKVSQLSEDKSQGYKDHICPFSLSIPKHPVQLTIAADSKDITKITLSHVYDRENIEEYFRKDPLALDPCTRAVVLDKTVVPVASFWETYLSVVYDLIKAECYLTAQNLIDDFLREKALKEDAPEETRDKIIAFEKIVFNKIVLDPFQAPSASSIVSHDAIRLNILEEEKEKSSGSGYNSL